MKKLGSIFLALALALGCMSMTVGAEGPNLPRTDLIFDGTKVATVTYLPPDYSVSAEVTSEIQAAFSYDAGTLMLNKPLSVMGIALEPAVTTLVLNADLTLTGNADAEADAFFTSSTLTLKGSGSLTIDALGLHDGMAISGGLTVDGPTLNILSGRSSGISVSGVFTLNSGRVITQGGESGLFVFAPTTPDVVTRAATPAAGFVMNGGYLKSTCGDGIDKQPAISVEGVIELNGV
ncbi:MAG: carbohydrate-binding domain-containing protein, partial [Oscillospiraceae bacterium]